MDGHMGRVFALKYHPSDPRVLVSAGWDDTVQFWDTRSKHSVRYTLGEGLVHWGNREGWGQWIGATERGGASGLGQQGGVGSVALGEQ